MNTLFIFGNGFDLNLGLKTSYRDFYNYYGKNHSAYDSIMRLKKHIGKNKDVYWSDLEIALGKYTLDFNTTEDFDEVVDDLRQELSIYLMNMQHHLEKMPLNKNKFLSDLVYPEKYLTPLEKEIFDKFKKDFLNNQWHFNIVTFNYTNSIEKILDVIESSKFSEHHSLEGTKKIGNYLNPNIEHIHGFANKRMVLGVNDLSQVQNKKLHNNIDILEAIIKPQCNSAIGEKSSDNFNSQIDTADLICVFGMSFGDSDKIWWEKIGDKLVNSNSRMIIFNKSADIDPMSIYKANRVRRKIKNHFLQQTGLSAEFQKIIDERVFVGVNTHMFKGIRSEKISINHSYNLIDANLKNMSK